jgi:hypothetical protein
LGGCVRDRRRLHVGSEYSLGTVNNRFLDKPADYSVLSAIAHPKLALSSTTAPSGATLFQCGVGAARVLLSSGAKSLGVKL